VGAVGDTHRGTRWLRVGALSTVESRLLPEALRRWHAEGAEQGDVGVNVVTGPSAFLLSRLRRGELDLVVGRMTEAREIQDLASSTSTTSGCCWWCVPATRSPAWSPGARAPRRSSLGAAAAPDHPAPAGRQLLRAPLSGPPVAPAGDPLPAAQPRPRPGQRRHLGGPRGGGGRRPGQR
jgi:DNA-binding transcriptional LysR family regulator